MDITHWRLCLIESVIIGSTQFEVYFLLYIHYFTFHGEYETYKGFHQKLLEKINSYLESTDSLDSILFCIRGFKTEKNWCFIHKPKQNKNNQNDPFEIFRYNSTNDLEFNLEGQFKSLDQNINNTFDDFKDSFVEPQSSFQTNENQGYEEFVDLSMLNSNMPMQEQIKDPSICTILFILNWSIQTRKPNIQSKIISHYLNCFSKTKHCKQNHHI